MQKQQLAFFFMQHVPPVLLHNSACSSISWSPSSTWGVLAVSWVERPPWRSLGPLTRCGLASQQASPVPSVTALSSCRRHEPREGQGLKEALGQASSWQQLEGARVGFTYHSLATASPPSCSFLGKDYGWCRFTPPGHLLSCGSAGLDGLAGWEAPPRVHRWGAWQARELPAAARAELAGKSLLRVDGEVGG